MCALLLAIGVGSFAAGASRAQDAPAMPLAGDAAAPPADTAGSASVSDAEGDSEIDWSQLNVDGFTLSREAAIRNPGHISVPDATLAWSSHDNADGSAALSVKQSVSPLWDTRIGADMTVVRQPSPLTESTLLMERSPLQQRPSQSTGTAWAAINAPGLASIWDQTAVEARIDPAQDQSRIGTSLSKSLKFDDDRYALSLTNGYDVVDQSLVPAGIASRTARSYETEQSVKLSLAEIGTSFTAGQSLSSTDDRWLHSIGAEQKLFDGVSITGAISQTATGVLDRSLTAAFTRSW
ncbi:MAG TPA: hypothetical protein VHC94_12405 [Nitrobacter sp.]|nr:hypothetical protein [Nitrobacter sp.]